MKKVLTSVCAVGVMLSVSTVPSFANVIHANGSNGKPSAVGSNTGSPQGMANRSATGTAMKFTNDGWRTEF